jgi:hypothetical protein
MQKQLGRSETLLETMARLREDRYLYGQAVLRIRNKSAELVPLAPNFAQRYVEEKLEAQKAETGRVRAVVLKARQEGVSTWTAGRFFHQTHLWAGRKALIIADAIDRAQAIFGIYERFWSELPEDLKPEVKARGNRRLLQFGHDSEIGCRPASDKDAGRAQTIHYLHCSEIAMWPELTQRDIWVSAIQAVPDQGSEVIVESTARGAGGLFHELWNLAITPGSGWIGIFLPWWIHEEYDADERNGLPTQEELDGIATRPDDFELQALSEGIPFDGQNYVLPVSRLAWRRRTIIARFGGDPVTLGKDATRDFQQEYPATAEEAFLLSGATFFDEDALRKLANKTRPPELVGNLERRLRRNEDGGVEEEIVLKESRRGLVSIWEKPQPFDHYTLGADTVEGKLVQKVRVTSDTAAAESGGRDFSSVHVYRLQSQERKVGGKIIPGRPRAMVATIHGQPATDILARQVELIGRWYACGGKVERLTRDDALLAIESNHSSGQRLLEYMRDQMHYKRMYWQREINTRTRQFTRAFGWRTDDKTRWILLDSLGELIRKELIEIPDKDTVRELTTFVFNDVGKPEAAEGTHDDRVISLALAALMGEREHRHASITPPPRDEYE